MLLSGEGRDGPLLLYPVGAEGALQRVVVLPQVRVPPGPRGRGVGARPGGDDKQRSPAAMFVAVLALQNVPSSPTTAAVCVRARARVRAFVRLLECIRASVRPSPPRP